MACPPQLPFWGHAGVTPPTQILLCPDGVCVCALLRLLEQTLERELKKMFLGG